MKENKEIKEDIIQNKIVDQMWYDYVKENYPVIVDKVVNDYCPAALERKTRFVDPKAYVRFQDFMKVAGVEAVKDLKRYFQNEVINYPIAVDELSKEELNQMFAILNNINTVVVCQENNVSLTDILVEQTMKKNR